MLKRVRTPILLITSVFACAVAVGVSNSQYTYAPPPGFGPGFPGAGFPMGYGFFPFGGGVWNGQAAALDAYGNLGKSQEEARILREQANQAKLDTKVKTIDVMAYERANKYWFSDEQADIQAKRVQAAMNNPPLPEITSGRALNTLLPWLDVQIVKGTHGPNVAVDPEVVRQMNISSGPTGGNPGVLRDINNLPWPVATIGSNQKKLDELLRQATYEASKSPIPPTKAAELRKQTDLVSQEVSTKFQKTEIDAAEFIDGNRFIDRIRDAIKALQQPSITQTLAGQGGPTGNTVEQVVQSMTSRGLTFAAAQPGHESAYVAMHRAFVNFGLSAGTADTGFRVRVGSLPGPGPAAPASLKK